MKKLALLFLQVIFVTSVYGQSTEYSAHLNSGLFSFGGASATENSVIIISDVGSEGNYTNNPFGTNKALSYGLSAQIQRVTGSRLIFGLQLGYELLRSQVNIVDVAGEFPNPPTSVSGQTTFKNGFITFFPHFGQRFILNNLDIDLVVGPEWGFNILSREDGEATTNNGRIIRADRERTVSDTDFRLRSSLTVYYKNWGISAGYSYGLSNYSSGVVGGNRERFSRLIRFGISYRIK